MVRSSARLRRTASAMEAITGRAKTQTLIVTEKARLIIGSATTIAPITSDQARSSQRRGEGESFLARTRSAATRARASAEGEGRRAGSTAAPGSEARGAKEAAWGTTETIHRAAAESSPSRDAGAR